LSQQLNAPQTPRIITVQRLLARQAAQAGVTFCLDDDAQEAPPLLLFSPAWAQPLISAYARVLAMLSLGDAAQVLFPCEFKTSSAAPLGLVCKEGPIDGSAAGLLRAAIVSRAAQEALGFTLFASRPQPQRINFMDVVRRCESPETLAGRALRCRSTDDWSQLASSLTMDLHLQPEDEPAEDVLQVAKT